MPTGFLHTNQLKRLAGAGGFEPPYRGIKIRCLATWLRPKRLGRLTARPPSRQQDRRRTLAMLGSRSKPIMGARMGSTEAVRSGQGSGARGLGLQRVAAG